MEFHFENKNFGKVRTGCKHFPCSSNVEPPPLRIPHHIHHNIILSSWRLGRLNSPQIGLRSHLVFFILYQTCIFDVEICDDSLYRIFFWTGNQNREYQYIGYSFSTVYI